MAPQVQLWFQEGRSKKELSDALIIAAGYLSVDSMDLRFDKDIPLRDNVGEQVGTMYIRNDDRRCQNPECPKAGRCGGECARNF